MKAELHSLNWPGADSRLADSQLAVFKYFEIPLRQHHIKADHSRWMDIILHQSKADIVVFIDNDCIPLSRKAVIESIEWANKNHSFVGIAQAANHIHGGRHIYAAPAFLAITKGAWRKLGQPSMKPTSRGDVAEELSWKAEEAGLTYKALYPTYFHHPSDEGLWRLGNYGYYGIGTIFADRFFHLYQGRLSKNVDLFVDVCTKVISGGFTYENFKSCIMEATN